MKIVIRADASVAIGTGHVMRCLTLADALRDAGAEVSFICADLTGHLGDVIERAGHVVRLLSKDAAADWRSDAKSSAACIEGQGHVDWLIVDHYGLGAQWETALRRCAKRIMAIDDLAEKSHDCDALLDQNYHADMVRRHDGLLPDRCVRLLGPRYALLRPEFRLARQCVDRTGAAPGRLLIFFGGSDPTNETEKALHALRKLGRADLHADVIVGATNPNRDRIEKLCGGLPNVSYHCQISHIASLMACADIALGAGGVTTLERCCLGLPAVVVAVADNQIDVSVSMAEAGCIRFLGKAGDVSADDMANALRDLTDRPHELAEMSANGMAMVDGNGCERVAAALLEPDLMTKMDRIVVRAAREDDARSLYEWRNTPEVRAASFDDRAIAWEDHFAWFHAALANPNRHLLIGEADDRPIGVLRYDRSGMEAEVSIYLVPGIAGQGWGTRLLVAGNEWVEHHLPGVARLRARIRPENVASKKAFARAGFIPGGTDYVFDLQANH